MKIPPKLFIVVAAVALAVLAGVSGVDMESVKDFLGLLSEGTSS
jgi:hypothetical protein